MHSSTCFALVYLTSTSVAVAISTSNVSQVNAFLESYSINPLRISTSDKAAGGTALACAIFGLARGNETVTALDTSIYTTEREAHW